MGTLDKLIISRDSSGDPKYRCDGNDDHVQINQALKYAHEHPDEIESVYLSGENTPFSRYVIDSPLLVHSGSILEGDPTAVLTIEDNNGWASQTPLIKQAVAKQSTKSKITFRGFTIDGNAGGNGNRRGDGFHNLMLIYYDDVEVSNMFLHDSLGDGLKVKYSESVNFHRNKVYNLGHDVLFADESQGVRFFENDVKTKTNSAIRFYNSNGEAFNNKIWTTYEEDAGGPGIQIQYIREKGDPDPMNSIEIYGNEFTDTYGPGIWIIAFGSAYEKSEACGIHIHDNSFVGCGTHPSYNWLGGIVFSGFYDTLIEKNKFKNCFGGAIVSMYPNDNRFSGLKPTGKLTPYITIVRDNEISGTQKRKGSCGGVVGADPEKTGQGIINYCPNTTRILSDRNYIWDNEGGAYFQVTSETDILHAPDTPEPEEPQIVLCSICQCGLWEITELNNVKTAHCYECGSQLNLP